jgi:hypothetical protein
MEVLQRPHMRRVYRVSCASVRFPLAPDRRQPIRRIFRLCQSLQLAFVFPLVRAALSSAHGQPGTQTARDANGSRARLPRLRRSHFFSPLQLSLRADSLRPLRRRESANQCALRPDPRHLRPLRHRRRVLRAGNGSQSRSHAWPTRARYQPGGPAPATGLPGRQPRGAMRIRSLPPEHGKGNVRITLEPGRKNLLRLRN